MLVVASVGSGRSTESSRFGRKDSSDGIRDGRNEGISDGIADSSAIVGAVDRDGTCERDGEGVDGAADIDGLALSRKDGAEEGKTEGTTDGAELGIVLGSHVKNSCERHSSSVARGPSQST